MGAGMKATFIYAYENEEWSTPLSIIREFESRGWEVDIISIGSNRSGQYYDRDIKNWLATNPKTDLVMYMDWGRFDSPLLNKAYVKAFWVQESGDDPQNFSMPKAEKFHITLTPDVTSCEQYKSLGINVFWWNHFADTRIQYPMEVQPEFIAVSTRGRGGSQFLDTLENHSNGMFSNQNGMMGIEHSEFLQKGLMVVQNSRHGEITRRIFEAMACGKMVLTDRLHESKKLHELFEDGKEIVFYGDIIDCINKMNEYGANHEKREAIAKAGMEKVLANHTQVQRVDLILEQFEKFKNG
jgi:hypothetical protein